MFKLILDIFNLNRLSNDFCNELLVFSVPMKRSLNPINPFHNFPFSSPTFWALVAFDLKCTWKLEACTVRVSVYDGYISQFSTLISFPLRV